MITDKLFGFGIVGKAAAVCALSGEEIREEAEAAARRLAKSEQLPLIAVKDVTWIRVFDSFGGHAIDGTGVCVFGEPLTREGI